VQGRLSSDKEIQEDCMAQYEEFTIDQGSDVTITLNLVNTDGSKKNLTGYSVSGKLKRTYNSDSADTTAFTGALPAPRTDGVVTLSLTNTQTNALKAPARYVYDVEISYVDSSANTIIERILEGRAQISPSATK